MRKPLKAGTILAVGSLGMATLMAGAAILLGDAEDLPRAALTGGVFGLVFFGGVAWAGRPGDRPSPETLDRVERGSRLLGILGAAAYAACVWMEHPGPLLVVAFCVAFGGFYLATVAELRLKRTHADPGKCC